MRFQRNRFVIVIATMLALGLSTVQAQDAGKKEHTFRGKVEKVDTKAKTLVVNGENVEGWMPAMTMTYVVDKEDVLTKIKAGNEITARVYDGDFKTLHDVRLVPPKSNTATPKASKK